MTSTDRSHDLKKLIIKSITTTTYDVANVIHHMFTGQYVAIEPVNGRDNWIKMPSGEHTLYGCELMQKITSDVLDKYLELSHDACDTTENEVKDVKLEISRGVTEVSYLLRDIDYRKKLMDELAILFYSPIRFLH